MSEFLSLSRLKSDIFRKTTALDNFSGLSTSLRNTWLSSLWWYRCHPSCYCPITKRALVYWVLFHSLNNCWTIHANSSLWLQTSYDHLTVNIDAKGEGGLHALEKETKIWNSLAYNKTCPLLMSSLKWEQLILSNLVSSHEFSFSQRRYRPTSLSIWHLSTASVK